MPWRSAIVATSATVALPSEGYRTVVPWIARSAARSSTAIWDGPSSPIDTPACDPQRRRSARPIAAMRIWSYARVRNAPNVAAKAIFPSACRPVCAPIIVCSAMYIWKKRSGATASTSSV